MGHPFTSVRRDIIMRFSCRICSTKYHFPCAGGSGLGRSAYSPPHLPLQVPHAPSQPAAGSESRRFANKHSKKALKASLTLGILLGMFFVAWLPFFVTNVTQVSKFPGFLLAERAFFFFFQWKLQLTLAVSHQAVCDCVPAGFFDVLTWLGYCNSTMNPIIYPLFMRDFKRAMGKYLPCCRRTGEPRPSAISLSMKNSNSGPRAATSLKNVLTLQAETDSVVSEVVANEHRLLPAAEGALPAPSAHLVGLFEMETSELELQHRQLGTPVA